MLVPHGGLTTFATSGTGAFCENCLASPIVTLIAPFETKQGLAREGSRGFALAALLASGEIAKVGLLLPPKNKNVPVTEATSRGRTLATSTPPRAPKVEVVPMAGLFMPA